MNHTVSELHPWPAARVVAPSLDAVARAYIQAGLHRRHAGAAEPA